MVFNKIIRKRTQSTSEQCTRTQRATQRCTQATRKATLHSTDNSQSNTVHTQRQATLHRHNANMCVTLLGARISMVSWAVRGPNSNAWKIIMSGMATSAVPTAAKDLLTHAGR